MDRRDAQNHPNVPPPSSFLGDLTGQRAVVMGIGHFGGGEAAARYLTRLGADVLATDMLAEDAIPDAAQRLRSLEIQCRFGEHRRSDFMDADLVIVNPAVPRPWCNEFVEAARAGGARLLTEIQLAIGDRDPKRTVGITGSAGKSTTTAMTAHALRRVRPDLQVVVAGNIGGSLLDAPPSPEASIITELSSFMLYWLAHEGSAPADRRSTGVCAITNISPNHLDWHDSFEHYRACKDAIRSASPGREPPIEIAIQDDEIARVVDRHLALRIPGAHNRRNAELAIRLAMAHLARREGTTPTADLLRALIDSMRDFDGLPHRLEHVGTWRGVTVLNDSKASTPEATLLALEACEPTTRVHLIAGGYDKGADLTPIRERTSRLAGLYAIGRTASKLLGRGARDWIDLESATRAAVLAARDGDTILLSPGCASWDQFRNFEARGQAFRDLARRLFEEPDLADGDGP